jgi:hypothetical protein
VRRSHAARGRNRRSVGGFLFVVFIALAIATGSALAEGNGAAPPRPLSTNKSTHASPAAAKGLTYVGLVQNAHGPCGHDFELAHAHSGGHVLCSHGPDTAPDNVDVTQYRSTADIVASGVNGNPTHTGIVHCIGDGVSGPRVQAVYAVASDMPDRFAQVAPSIATWAGEIDGVFSQSAAESGGDRHVRFVTNPDCSLVILHVVLSPTGAASFDNMITELQQLGYNRPLTKYLVWMDANVYCGIANIVSDDSPGQNNANNTVTDYARIDTGCWGRSDHLSEAHELMHTLGAVQTSAPHATAFNHCTDEYDVMCYQDSAGLTMSYPCPIGHEWLFDCNDDDYFNTSPSPGSYLATHWDTANSQFLDTSSSGTVTTTTNLPASTTTPAAPITTTTAPAPTTLPPTTVATTTLPPPTTSTVVFSGSLSAKHASQSYFLKVGAGAASDALQFSATGGGKSKGGATPMLSLTVYASDSTIVLNTTGPSVLRQLGTLAAGTYTWQVSGSTSASFALSITYTN